MKRIAIIKKCDKADIDPSRPKSEQSVCLYAHPKTASEKKRGHGRLLGRHPDKKSAIKQEKAIKAKQLAARAYVAVALAEDVLKADSEVVANIALVCADTLYGNKKIEDLKIAIEQAALKLGSFDHSVDDLHNKAKLFAKVAKNKLKEVLADVTDDKIRHDEMYSIWWDGESEVWRVSNKDDSISIEISADKHSTKAELIDAALTLYLPGNPTTEDFKIIPFSGDVIYGNYFKKEIVMSSKKNASGWEGEPKGWTNKSKKEFFDSLGGDVEECIDRIKGDVDNPGAFCSSLADEVKGPAWRHEPRKRHRKSSVERIKVNGVIYKEVHGAVVTDKVKEFFKSLMHESKKELAGGEKSCGCRGRQANNIVELPTDCVAEIVGVSFSNNPNTVFEKKDDTWLVDGVDSNGVIDDPLIKALISYCEMNKTAKNKFARLDSDSFMKPEIIQDVFYFIVDNRGESLFIPAEFIDEEDARLAMKAVEDGHEFNVRGTTFSDFVFGDTISEIAKEDGWFARLSAPGYLDATEWDGPFDSAEEAEEHLEELYGDDYVDEDEYGLPPVDEK